MQFPHYFNLFGVRLHPHAVLEVIAYSAGFQFYLLLRRRWRRPAANVPFEQNMWLIVGAVFGALFGSKLLAWLESAPHYRSLFSTLGPAALIGGKTIVGGLLGGWAGVELVKKKLGITRRTGDLYVFPLVLGTCIGRVGCFLTGLPDHTHGVETSLAWGVDFGDGLRRHPTQLYEIVFLLVLGTALLLRTRRPWVDGEIFRLFMLGYLLFRFAIEFIKPRDGLFLGLSAIQCACASGALVCAGALWRLRAAQPQTGGDDDRTLAPARAG
jgi:prolipoprotein diacylglyceryltransferase